MAHRGMKFGIFLAPFHRVGENPTLAINRDVELLEWLDWLGYDEAWIGEARKELTGRHVEDVAGAARFALLQPIFERVLRGETVSTELCLPQPDGATRWESVHYAPNRDSEGSVVGIYAVHTDVHDAKSNEDALRRANWMLS